MSKRSSADDVVSKNLQFERQLCLRFIRRVLGWFLAGSRHVLGRISARSWQDLAEISPPLAMRLLGSPEGSQRNPREAKGLPKSAKKEPKGRQGSQKGCQRELKGSPKGAHGAPNTMKNRSCIWKAFWTETRGFRNSVLAPFWQHFGS